MEYQNKKVDFSFPEFNMKQGHNHAQTLLVVDFGISGIGKRKDVCTQIISLQFCCHEALLLIQTKQHKPSLL